jgi:hypothetical protein
MFTQENTVRAAAGTDLPHALRHSDAEVVLIHGGNHRTVPSALRAIKLKTINRSLVSFEASRWTLIPHFCREFSLLG